MPDYEHRPASSRSRVCATTQRITRRIQYKRAAGTPLPVASLLEAAVQQYGHLTATPQLEI